MGFKPPSPARFLWNVAWRARERFRKRRQRKRAEKLGETSETTEIRFEKPEETMATLLERFRTSTKSGAAGVLSFAVLAGLAHFWPDFPTAGLEEWITAVVMYFTARWSSTPTNPGAL